MNGTRRALVLSVGGALAARPFRIAAQPPPRVFRVGVLSTGPDSPGIDDKEMAEARELGKRIAEVAARVKRGSSRNRTRPSSPIPQRPCSGRCPASYRGRTTLPAMMAGTLENAVDGPTSEDDVHETHPHHRDSLRRTR